MGGSRSIGSCVRPVNHRGGGGTLVEKLGCATVWVRLGRGKYGQLGRGGGVGIRHWGETNWREPQHRQQGVTCLQRACVSPGAWEIVGRGW